MKVKYLLIVRDVEPPQGRGKMAHTLTNALELNASGHDVKVLFEGQGVEWLRLFEQREDGFTKGYGQRFDQAHQAGVLAGACNFCSSIRLLISLLRKQSTTRRPRCRRVSGSYGARLSASVWKAPNLSAGLAASG